MTDNWTATRFAKTLLSALPAFAAALCLQAEGGDFIFGACTHRWTEPDVLPTLTEAGIMSNRDEISWAKCEREKGVIEIPESYNAYIDKCIASGLSPLNILDYSNKLYDNGDYPKSPEAVEAFTRYCEAVVTKFKGRIKYQQVWNEWDGGCGGMPGKGDPEVYVKLLAAVYPRIKAIDPSIIVVANAVCTGDKFFKRTIELGILKHCDAMDLHPYCYGEARALEKWHARMLDIDKFLKEANGGKEFPLFITEIGWPTQIDARGSTEEVSADYMAGVYLLSLTMPHIKGVWWYSFRDDGWDYKYNENNFGMVRNDLTPKRPWFVMKDLTRLLRDAAFVERLDAGDPQIYLLKFRRMDGSTLLAAWSQHEDGDWQIQLANSRTAKASFELTLLGCGSQRRTFNPSGKDAKMLFPLVLRKRPFVLEGDLKDVRLASIVKRDFPESERPSKEVTKAPAVIGKATHISSTSAPAVYKFGGERNYRRLTSAPWGGKSDLDASFSMRWSKDALLLDVEVADDVFSQSQKDDETWRGDSLQLAFHKLGEKGENGLARCDLDVALTKDGPAVYFQKSGDEGRKATATDIKAVITRNGAKTLYKLEIPVKSVGLPELEPGGIIAFSIVANDNDGTGRKGYLHWGDGIGGVKEPTLYNWLIMEN